MKIQKKYSVISVLFSLIVSSNLANAKPSRQSSLRTFGDYAQIINPVIGVVISSQEKGAGHFAIIYGQSFVTMHGTKFIANKMQWNASKRPYVENKKSRYDGMPSGHTNSAWLAASYVRTYSEDYKYASIPLYITAAITGYSRIYAKEHTFGQVIAGAALAELVTYINSKLAWSDDYQSANFYFGGDEITASFVFKF
jgi:hypothetical protein